MIQDIIGYTIVAIIGGGGFFGAYKQFTPPQGARVSLRLIRILYSLTIAFAGLFSVTLFAGLSGGVWVTEDAVSIRKVWLVYTGAPALFFYILYRLTYPTRKHDRLV